MGAYKVGRHRFQWTNLHLSREKTDQLRYEFDELGSNAVRKLQQIFRGKTEKHAAEGQESFDMYALLRDNFAEDETLTSLWKEAHHVPDWVDWAQIERGQKFFYRYALANVTGFALQGFVGENSAASGVVEVLVRTGGFSTSMLRRRLLETFQFILEVTQDIESIKPGGEGHISTLRVRLLHSAVRERIMELAGIRSNYFDVKRFGVPINTLDSIHSVATFCCNPMWLQLPLMGVYPSQQEAADYIALFRYVAYLLATPNEYFASAAKAKATMESMLLHERQITDTSVVVGYNLVQCLKDMPPIYISAGFIEAGSRVLNGDEFCDSLGFGRPSLLSYVCFRGLCWFTCTLALGQRLFPYLDDVVVNYCRRCLNQVTRSKTPLGNESKMNFKYVPQFGKLTGKEGKGQTPLKSSLFVRPGEAFFFLVFVLGILPLLGTSAAVFILYSLKFRLVNSWLI